MATSGDGRLRPDRLPGSRRGRHSRSEGKRSVEATTADPNRPEGAGDPATLKRDAISFTDGLVIALASTAPVYSLAAVIGSIVVLVGLQAPAALVVSFVPM